MKNTESLETKYLFYKQRLTHLMVLNFIFLAITLYTIRDVSLFTVVGLVGILTVGVLHIMTNNKLSKIMDEMDNDMLDKSE
ncbi:MAG TPA: hypothetical protein EYH42_00310 [Sulfurovum sp.]|nr:hypothetical protein [Sulfurovum sp.]